MNLIFEIIRVSLNAIKTAPLSFIKVMSMTGLIHDFRGGGGGVGRWRKRLWAHIHIMRAHTHHELQSPLRPGAMQGLLKALEAMDFRCSLSYYPSLIFKHSDTKWVIKNTFYQNLVVGGGGGACPLPSLDPLLYHNPLMKTSFKKER